MITGRNLPEANASWESLSQNVNLPPISLDDFSDYCTTSGLQIPPDILEGIHLGTQGKPGFFIDIFPSLEAKYIV